MRPRNPSAFLMLSRLWPITSKAVGRTTCECTIVRAGSRKEKMPGPVRVTNVETVVPADTFIYSRTDLKGIITEANEVFAEISGYTVADLIGKPHNIVRHPDMPKAAFADLWKSLNAGRPWQGLVKNRRSDGGFYWVLANVSPVRENGRIVGFQSLRHKPSRDQIQAAAEAYAHIQAGSRALRIEEGRIVPARAQWMEFFFHPSTQFAWSSYAALLAGICGFVLLLADLRIPASAPPQVPPSSSTSSARSRFALPRFLVSRATSKAYPPMSRAFSPPATSRSPSTSINAAALASSRANSL
jgi:PAS domain S-box-containing protein